MLKFKQDYAKNLLLSFLCLSLTDLSNTLLNSIFPTSRFVRVTPLLLLSFFFPCPLKFFMKYNSKCKTICVITSSTTIHLNMPPFCTALILSTFSFVLPIRCWLCWSLVTLFSLGVAMYATWGVSR